MHRLNSRLSHCWRHFFHVFCAAMLIIPQLGAAAVGEEQFKKL